MDEYLKLIQQTKNLLQEQLQHGEFIFPDRQTFNFFHKLALKTTAVKKKPPLPSPTSIKLQPKKTLPNPPPFLKKEVPEKREKKPVAQNFNDIIAILGRIAPEIKITDSPPTPSSSVHPIVVLNPNNKLMFINLAKAIEIEFGIPTTANQHFKEEARFVINEPETSKKLLWQKVKSSLQSFLSLESTNP